MLYQVLTNLNILKLYCNWYSFFYFRFSSFSYNLNSINLNIKKYENKQSNNNISNRKDSTLNMMINPQYTQNGGWIVLNTSIKKNEL